MSERSFPTLPAITGVPSLSNSVTMAFAGALVVALVAALVPKTGRLAILAALGLAGLLVVFDINRLQPWLFQYLLLLAAFLARKPSDTWAYAGTVVAANYFWSGIQKLNLAFGNEIFPWLFSVKAGAPTVGLLAACVEAAIGVALVFPRARRVGLIGLICLHVAVLAALGPMGHNFNSVVWPWNLTLPLIAIALFIKSDATIFPAAAAGMGRVLLLLVGLLPALSLAGWWDDNLSSSLYSGRTRDAMLRMPLNAARKLGIRTDNIDGPAVVDVTTWAFADLNVPPYPAPRNYRNLAKKVPGAELYIRERTLLEGATRSFKVDRQ